MTERRPYASIPFQTSGMPPGIPYIIGNEAAERFSFYGMRTILTVFMVNYLWLMGAIPGTQMSNAAATERFHSFVALTYLTPVFGAILADVFFGKFRVIVGLSIVYCLGHATLAMMGVIGQAETWLIAGLWLISLGSGGIKPCVSAHVGDQFGKANRHLISRMFDWFYWTINLGAFVSTLLTPWLLEWYGPHLAFGVPGVLMALATLVFWMGRWKFIHIPAGGWSFFREMFSPGGIKALGKLSGIYFFIAIFWALYDQSGSSWVLQTENMDRRFLGVDWLPSQIQALNPILILTFIPLFSYVVYPLVNRVFRLTPLRKIAIGLFLTVISFLLVAVAQQKIDAGETPSVSWQLVAFVALTAGEVMVSIVGLEFSYTQAPKSMKSVVMALFFFAVSAGNFLTAQINHFIQVPSPLDKISAISNEVIHGGFDGASGTMDDLRITFDENSQRIGLAFTGQAELGTLMDQYEAVIVSQNFAAPSQAEGEALALAVLDPWGRPYRYRLLHRDLLRVSSDGPDGRATTRWDQGATLSIVRPEEATEDSTGGWWRDFLPDRTWVEQRKLELGLAPPPASADTTPTFEREFFVGGQVKLEGAAYFWFFSGLMISAAAVFLVVVRFYRPREYYHGDEEEVPMESFH
jgi:POT family proton-dependent oligopeptide transporter